MGKIDELTKITIKNSPEKVEKELIRLGISYEKIDKAYKLYLKSNLMNDLKFRQIAKSKKALEEILRVLLKDKKLRVKVVLSQKDYSEAIFHGVVLDCEVILGSGEIVNIEIQNSFTDDPFCRMSYNQSIIRVENAPKDKNFKSKDLVRIISIMICNTDIVGNGKAISKFVLKEEEDNTIIDDKVSRYFVNVTAKTDDEYLKELFKVWNTNNYFNAEMYPELSKAKDKANKLERGEYMMFNYENLEFYDDVLKAGETRGFKRGREEGEARGVKKGREEGRDSVILSLIKKGKLTISEAIKDYGISESSLKDLVSTT